MAALKSMLAVAVVGAAGCGKLQGTGGPVPPLASFEVEASGAPPANADLQVALVWGEQWLVEPLCILPDDPRDNAAMVDALKQAGCRDPFGFVPSLVTATVPIGVGAPATIDLFSLPSADIMVGDLTARVAYGSFIVYDDRNHDGTLNLAVPNRPDDMRDGEGQGSAGDTQTSDVVVGASFVSMTAPDTRVAYREGAFITSGFYPRAGCGDPPPAFSIDSASGFTAQAAIDATLMGTVPKETDPSQCVQRAPASGSVSIALQPTTQPLQELACTERRTDSSVRYREPDADPPDLTNRTFACVHHPSFGMPSDLIELVISGRTDDSCEGLTHFILKGCREGPDCGSPDWDHSLAPPSWWPC
jgi:hypothetical protein